MIVYDKDSFNIVHSVMNSSLGEKKPGDRQYVKPLSVISQMDKNSVLKVTRCYPSPNGGFVMVWLGKDDTFLHVELYEKFFAFMYRHVPGPSLFSENMEYNSISILHLLSAIKLVKM